MPHVGYWHGSDVEPVACSYCTRIAHAITNLLYDSCISLVTDHPTHAYPWLRDCNSCTYVQIGWFKLSVQKLSAMSEIIDGIVSKSILEKAEKGAVSVTTSGQLATFSEGFVLANTEANTEWAVRNLEA